MNNFDRRDKLIERLQTFDEATEPIVDLASVEDLLTSGRAVLVSLDRFERLVELAELGKELEIIMKLDEEELEKP